MPEHTPLSRRQVHGRRMGRPLSSHQQKLIEALLPQLALEPAAPGFLDLHVHFPGAKDFALEIGFGGGEHLACQAQANPSRGYIGCEPFLNGVGKLLTHIESASLSNVRIYPDDARALIAALPEGSMSAVYLLFPDPWPKLRHHKRRFLQVDTIGELARVMKCGAEFRVGTDHMDTAVWTLSHFLSDRRFDWLARCAADWRVRPDDWPATRYEQKAVAAGRTCVYLRFLRV